MDMAWKLFVCTIGVITHCNVLCTVCVSADVSERASYSLIAMRANIVFIMAHNKVHYNIVDDDDVGASYDIRAVRLCTEYSHIETVFRAHALILRWFCCCC